MSGHEPGWMPPDHMTTAEFRLPKDAGEAPTAEDAAPLADETVTDRPVDLDATYEDPAAVEALPVDDPEEDLPVDDVPETVTDFSVPPVLEEEAPATVTDFAVAETPAVPIEPPTAPQEPQVVAQFEQGAVPLPEQEPMAPVSEEPWTALFGSEQEQERAGLGTPPVPKSPSGGPAVEMHQPAPVSPEAGTQPSSVPQPESGVQHVAGASMAAAAAVPAGGVQAAAMPAGGIPGPYGTPSPPPGSGSGKGARRGVLILGAVGAVAVLAGAAVGTIVLSGGKDSDKKTASASTPSVSPTTGASGSPTKAGTPSPTTSATPGASGAPVPSAVPTVPGQSGAPTAPAVPGQPTTAPVGPVVTGKGITYQLMQQEEGYYEGRLVITNTSNKPMKGWKITFDAPKNDVKNLWGGRLVHGGDKVEIQSEKGAEAIPPGATWAIQYGAAGSAANPKGCRVNGKPCGF
ncbi:cellulose binding domain-containing protein [Actinomadura barringtoniae]|uniref:Cellulose binding domain-containing protein n=1 Tax=Actinomadura barringtoniae TaxID=1427535 RepID=A0A939PM99_9ACTN|nr:cellulose binding domain-containing protein [Actinomadura barringtoniae]MBO2454910.1 cellulose binding domain-containing protein [Actinomadura barringtoniae]